MCTHNHTTVGQYTTPTDEISQPNPRGTRAHAPLFVLSERASVRTFFGATTSQRPSYLIKTPHHHHHNTTEEEDRADNTPSPPPLAALFVVGGGGGRRREEKKKRKNILYARNAFFCMMYSISVSEPNIPI